MQTPIFKQELSAFLGRRIAEMPSTLVMRDILKVTVFLTDNAPTHDVLEDAVLVPKEDLPPNMPAGMRVYKVERGSLILYIVFFPPNVTSRCQPLDQGIIHSVKAAYRRYFMQWLLSEYDIAADDVDLGKIKPNLKDAIRWLKLAWRDVHPEVVRNCARASGILPKVVEAEFKNMSEKNTGIKLPSQEIEELTELLHKWSYKIAGPAGDPVDVLTAKEFVCDLEGEDGCTDQPSTVEGIVDFIQSQEYGEVEDATAGHAEQGDVVDVDDVPPVVPSLPVTRALAKQMLAFLSENPTLGGALHRLEGTPEECMSRLSAALDRQVVTAAHKQTTLLEFYDVAGP
jgi:hypothetical protein